MSEADKPARPRQPAAAGAAPDAAQLRHNVERQLTQQGETAAGSATDLLKLLHELQVQQNELEMQNEALRAAQAEIEAGLRFADLYEFAPVGYFSVGRDSTIRLLNLAGSSLLGVARSQLNGRRLAAYVAVDSRPSFNAFLAKVFAERGREACELNLLVAGQGPAAAVHIEGVTDEQGQVCNLAVTDISERKRLEDIIRRRDQYQRALLDNIPCLIWLKDEQSRYLAVNTPFAATFGWPSPEALVGKSDFDIAPVDLAEAYRADDRSVLESGVSKCLEEPIEAGGERRWFETCKSPVTLDGRVIGTVGFARDISQRREMDECLRESEAFNIAVLNSLTAHIVVLDETGQIVAANTAWREFAAANYSTELAAHALGLHYCSVCGSAIGQPCARPACQIWAGIDAVLKGEEACFTLEFPCDVPGQVLWFRVSVHPLPAPRRGAVVAHEDITERKKAEDQLRAAKAEAERANNAKSRFLAAASHDLRQPLSALGLYVGVLKNKVAPADGPLLSNMRNCVSSLSELLTDLLDLSKLDAGVVTPELSDFAVADLLANLVAVHAPEALLKGLHPRCVSSDLTARTDPVLFRRLLGNLIANAIRYTERGGVLVGCRRRQGKIWIEVWDTGVGIPADKIDEIFEEFRQLGHDERNRGSGLGLAIVARSAALLGLQIRVRSRPGKGSMFAVELPLGRASKAVARREAKPRPLRIALVDDNAGVLNALVCALEDMGHQVVAAAAGKELLGLLGSQPPDVVVSDYRLAGRQTGFDVIAAARKSFGNQLPALLITGDTDPKLMRSMADRGIVVQHKPLDIEALQLCIEHVTNRRWS